MLNADLIGFLLFEYTRNFLSCCKRMLGLEYEFQRGGFLGVEYEGRHVILQVSTFGISPAKVESRLEKLSALQTAPGRRSSSPRSWTATLASQISNAQTRLTAVL